MAGHQLHRSLSITSNVLINGDGVMFVS